MVFPPWYFHRGIYAIVYCVRSVGGDVETIAMAAYSFDQDGRLWVFLDLVAQAFDGCIQAILVALDCIVLLVQPMLRDFFRREQVRFLFWNR